MRIIHVKECIINITKTIDQYLRNCKRKRKENNSLFK